MPQLNPTPWFLTLTLIWFILMTIFMNKATTIIHPNPPTNTNLNTNPTPHWAWPWY